jgi:hypothetical protein
MGLQDLEVATVIAFTIKREAPRFPQISPLPLPWYLSSPPDSSGISSSPAPSSSTSGDINVGYFSAAYWKR